MSELLSAIVENWDALDQGRVNGVLLILLIVAVFVASWGVRRFFIGLYEGIRHDIRQGTETLHEAIDEIKELKLNERTQDANIEHLKEDIDTLFGRTRKRRNP